MIATDFPVMKTGDRQTTVCLQYGHKPQSGVVLVVSLIMLLLLTVVGLSGMQGTMLEEKMAGNTRDRNLAFQAAESALRDGEEHTKELDGVADFLANCDADPPADKNYGLCYNGALPYPNPIWEQVDWNSNKQTLEYGQRTGAKALAEVYAQPRYIVEGLNQGGECQASGSKFCYRVTVRAQGRNPNTVVWLQSIFKPRP